MKKAIKKLKKQVSGILDILELIPTRAELQTIAKHVQNLEAEKCSCHTNTQKTDKNATEGKQEGKKEYFETIVTNEMFNEELERFFRLEKVLTPYIKYTSTKNTPEYIASLIYALDERINCPQAINLIRSKLKSKGEHYNKESDRYANIKDALKRNKEEEPHLFANWTVVDKINSYKDKHIQWLIDTRGTEQTKTDLQEAYIDVICYCIMCYIYLKFNPEVKNG